MSKELSVISPQPMQLREIIDIANAFYASGMFKDVTSAAQAIVKIQAGQEVGISPFMAMSGLHVISGKVTIGGGVIAAKIKASVKYDYKLLEKTDILCRMEFFEEGVSQGIEKFDAEDAKRAGTQNMHKYPRNMLFNRCVSNGYKSYCPDIFIGPVYVPEEFGKVDEAEAEVSTTPANSQAQAAPLTVLPKKALPDAGEEYENIVNFLKTGGTVDKLRIRYELTVEQAKALELRARQTTQEDIHAANAGFVAPTPPAAPAEEALTTDPF